MHFQLLTPVTAGSGTEPPVTGAQTFNTVGIASRQWVVAAGTTTPWLGVDRDDLNSPGILQYAAGAYVTYNGHLWRALRTITRGGTGNDGRTPVPVVGDDWERETSEIPTSSPALIYDSATSQFSFADGIGVQPWPILQALDSPFIDNVTSQAHGSQRYIDLNPLDTDDALRTAWSRFASTASLDITVGNNIAYPDPLGTSTVDVAWPMVDGTNIVTQATLDPQLALNGLDVTPGSVRVGGDQGAFIWRPELDSITTSGNVLFGTTVGNTVSYRQSTNSGAVVVIPGPAPNLDATGVYLVRVTESDIDGFPAGDYLSFTAIVTDDGGATFTVELRNLRPVVNGIARDPLTPFAAPDTSTGVALDIFNFTSDVGLLDLLDARNDELVLSVSSATDVVDFTNLPTVNGVPLGLTDEEQRVVNASTSTGVQDVISQTEYGGGFLLRTESNAQVGNEISATGDVVSTLSTGDNPRQIELLELSAGIWTVNFNASPAIQTPVSYTHLTLPTKA